MLELADRVMLKWQVKRKIVKRIFLAGFMITLSPIGPFASNSFFFFISKVAIIKTKSVTIAFFLVPALSFSPFLFLRYCDFGAVLGLKKPAF